MAAASVETLASDMKAMFLDQAKRAEMIVCQLKRRRPEDAQAIYKTKKRTVMEGCCESMVKYFMFFINFLFALAGLLLIGVGAYIQINAKTYLDFLADNYLNTPIFIIIAGVIIFVVAFFGCCGAWQESSCMIYTYAALLTIILIGEVAAGIAAFVLKGELKTVIQEKMSEGMENYGKPGYEGVTQTWNMIQYDFQCCGSANYTDWKNYMTGVPDNCCKTITDGCGKKPGFESEINQEGCLTKFEGLFVGNMGIVGGAAIGIFLVELFGIIIACVLACRIRKYNRIV